MIQISSSILKIIYLSTITKYESNSFDMVSELSLSNILKAAFNFSLDISCCLVKNLQLRSFKDQG